MIPDAEEPARTLYVIVCGAGSAGDIATFVRLAQAQGWRVCVVTTPRAATSIGLRPASWGRCSAPSAGMCRRPREWTRRRCGAPRSASKPTSSPSREHDRAEGPSVAMHGTYLEVIAVRR